MRPVMVRAWVSVRVSRRSGCRREWLDGFAAAARNLNRDLTHRPWHKELKHREGHDADNP